MSGPLLSIPIHRLAGAADLPLPSYQTPGAAAMDLYAALANPLELAPGQAALIPCGFAIALPEGLEAQVRPRSGLALKHMVTVLNAPGTIDSDYRGEVQVILVNHGKSAFAVKHGDRIAQLVIASVHHATWQPVDALPPTARGSGGFGHTGR